MRIDGPSINVSSVAATLHKQFIGSRWLEARESSANEFAFYSRAAEAAKRRAGHAAAYRRPPQADAVRAPADERDVLVICHGTPMDVVDGRIELNNLLDGRVDVLSRCATAALFVSHGMRRQTRLWLHLAVGHQAIAQRAPAPVRRVRARCRECSGRQWRAHAAGVECA